MSYGASVTKGLAQQLPWLGGYIRTGAKTWVIKRNGNQICRNHACNRGAVHS